MISFRQFKNQQDTLMEGGAFGHLEHPYDVEDFTFKELKDIVKKAFSGDLEYVEEKTDGQNILVSWKDGKIIFARNKSHLKNAGENAMGLKELISKFAGRGSVSEAFKLAGIDLDLAIKAMTPKQQDKIFQQGKKFMSLEIIYAKNPNIILYDKDELRFHGTLEYDENGNLVSQINKEDARMLAGMIKSRKAHSQKTFALKALKVPTLPKLPDYDKQALSFIMRISKIQKDYGLKDNNHLHSYKNSYWEEVVKRNSKIDQKLRDVLVMRWSRGVKKPTIAALKKANPEHAKFIDEIEKQHKVHTKQMMQPFDRLFLEMGALLMKDMSDLMVINKDKSIQYMKKGLEKLEKDIAKSKSPEKMEKFKQEIDRLNAMGGTEAMIPSEGITFMYKGKLLKLTGTFAPINQLLGLLRFER